VHAQEAPFTFPKQVILRRTGLLPDDPVKLQKAPRLFLSLGPGVAESLPRRVELRDLLPPVGHQGEQSSCVGWAMAYYAYSAAIAARQDKDTTLLQQSQHQFSPAFLYNRRTNRTQDEGMSFSQAFDLLKEGCATMADMPYNPTDSRSQPSAKQLEKARLYARGQWVGYWETGQAANIPEMQAYLAKQRLPLVTGILAFPTFQVLRKDVLPAADFAKLREFVYDGPYPADFDAIKAGKVKPEKLGHAVTIAGYDQDRKAFLLVNSWGKNWGNDGFLWVSENFIQKCSMGIWAVRPGGPFALGNDSSPDLRLTIR